MTAPGGTAPLITLRRAGVSFGATRALQGIDLALHRGPLQHGLEVVVALLLGQLRERGLELLAALEAAGWTIKRDGKRSVATSPDGKVVTLRLPKVEPESASSRPMDA